MTKGIETSCFNMKTGNSLNVFKGPCSPLGEWVFAHHLGLASGLQASLSGLLSMAQNIVYRHFSIRGATWEQTLPECAI